MACGYRKIVSKGCRPYYYLKIAVMMDNLEHSFSDNFDAIQLKHVLIQNLRSLYGELGSAGVLVDVLSYCARRRESILRVVSSGYLKLRSAMALSSEYSGHQLALHVTQVSSHLMALASDSRNYCSINRVIV